MKNLILLLITIISINFAPVLIGMIQYQNAIAVMQNLGNECNDGLETDGQIEDVLRVFNFDIDCMSEPNTYDYYIAGTKTMRGIFLP